MIDELSVQKLVRLALYEDKVSEDITTNSLLAFDRKVGADVVAREAGILSGTLPFVITFAEVDAQVDIQLLKNDGETLEPGEVVLRIAGLESSILKAERTALNFLQRLSGIATLTRRYVERLEGTGVTLLDTRKTTPGMRLLEKKAVRDGGGSNHRLNLESMAMVKENHIRMAGSITVAVERIRISHPDALIEVEVTDLDELSEVLDLDVERVMLDNFPVKLVEEAVRLVNGRIDIEVSGNVSLERIGKLALPGVNFVSVGGLTHSFRSLDLSLLVRAPRENGEIGR